MLKLSSALLIAIALTVSSPAYAQSVLCGKKTIAVKNGKVPLNKALYVRQGVCNKGEIELAKGESAATVMQKLLTVDGSGSGIDADTIDGIDSSALATKATTDALASQVTAAQNGQTAASILSKLSTVDGNGSGVDADTIDGIDSSTLATTAVTEGLDARVTAVEVAQSSVAATTNALDTGLTALKRGPRVIHVGTSDAQYTSLSAAVAYVNSQTRDADTRYLIELAPGVYTLNAKLVIPTFTQITGAGPFQSIITGAVTAELMELRSSSGLSDLAIINTSTVATSATGLRVTGVVGFPEDAAAYDVTLDNVRVVVEQAGPTVSHGVYVSGGGNVIMRNSRVVVGGAPTNYGVLVHTSTGVHLYNSIVSVGQRLPGGDCYGIWDQSDGTATFQNMDVSASTRGYSIAGGTKYVTGGIIRTGGTGVAVYNAAFVVISHALVDAGLLKFGSPVCAFVATPGGQIATSDCTLS